MPLLKMNEFGEIVEYGFGNTARVAEFTPDDGTVIFGEYGADESKVRLAVLQKRQKQLALKKKQEAARKARQAAIAQKKKERKEARIRARQKQIVDARRKKDEAFVRGAARSKNPFTGQFRPQLVGDAKAGFKAPAQYMTKSDLQKVALPSVKKTKEFGVNTLYSWPPKSNFARGKRTVSAPLAKVSTPSPVPSIQSKTPQVKKVARIDARAFGHPLAMYSPNAMGDLGGFKIKIKAPKIKVPSLKKVVKEVGKVGGKMLNAPLDLTHKALTTVPGVKDVYKGVDKLTGNTLSSLHRTLTLPGRALQTGKVSKQELAEGLINVVKVGAIVVSGGSATALIAASAGALKQGPLGKTPLGNTILSIGEVAAVASLAKQGLSKALEKKATDMLAAKAGTEVGKKAGPIGAIAASAAVAAGSAGFNNAGSAANAATATQAADKAQKIAAEEVTKSGMKFSTQAAAEEAKKIAQAEAKKAVSKEFEKKTGIPLDIATRVAKGDVPTPAELKKQLVAKMVAAPDQLKNELHNIDNHIKNAEPKMRQVLETKKAELAKQIVMREANVQKIQEHASREYIKENEKLIAKVKSYEVEHNALKKLEDEAKSARAKASVGTANLADKQKWANLATELEKKVLAQRNRMKPLEDEIAELSLEAERIKEDGAGRIAIAEYGGATALTPSTTGRSASDLAHPMLIYGLV